jgi:hypothetical protein
MLCSVEDARRHGEGYHGTARRAIGNGGGTAVRPHDCIHEGKPQPVPERLLSPNKTFEYACPDVRRKSGTIVFDNQFGRSLA